MMNLVSMVVEDALLEEDFLKVLKAESPRQTLSLGDREMHYSEVNYEIEESLLGVVEGATGYSVAQLAIFRRYDCGDESFRVHSDSEIGGVKPDIAFVYYIKGSTGTALMKHEEFGKASEETKIFNEDDGKWSVAFHCPPKPNSMFIYDAKLFHTRYPFNEEEQREVIVGFLTVTGDIGI